MFTTSDKFETMCTVKADLSALCHKADKIPSNSLSFWRLNFDIEFLFGLTEYQARLKWIENVSTVNLSLPLFQY